MKTMPKRFRSLLLCAAVAFAMLPGGMPRAYAAESFPPGLSAASVSVGTGSTLASSTTQLVFGGQSWYVAGFNGTGINKGEGRMTLLAKGSMGSSVFRTDGYNPYGGSTLQAFINALPGGWDTREQAQMVGLTLGNVSGTQPTGQKIWALDALEAGAVSKDVLQLADGAWWLRTPSQYSNPRIVANGEVQNYGPPTTQALLVRPGMTLDLSGVAFAAPAAAKDSAVDEVSAVSLGSEMKLTLLDNSGLGLSVTGLPAELVRNQGIPIPISFDFSGAQTGSGRYVSCVLVSNADHLVKYYAKLSTEASGSVAIPTDKFLPASYTLLIYNEEIGSGGSSDYASTPVSAALTISGSNAAPKLKAGVSPSASSSVSVGSPFTQDLSAIFEDPDNDALSYRVYINSSAAPVPAAKNYSFTPGSAGVTTLRFTAYDGAHESPSYTVTLTAGAVGITKITPRTEGGVTTLGWGGSIQLYADIEPDNATNKVLKWTAAVTGGSQYAKGDIDAANMLRLNGFQKDATVTIRAAAQDGSGKYGEIVLKAIEYPVIGISVTAAGGGVYLNTPVQMRAAVQPSKASQDVVWSITQGAGLASITPSGTVTATGLGSITVRATSKDGTAVYGETAFQVAKIPQTAPAAPTLVSKQFTLVTLNSMAGAEYSLDGIHWQGAATFLGLTPNTAYSFRARMAETGTHSTSPASDVLAVTTDKPPLSGSVSILGTPQYGQTLTADTTLLIAGAPGYALGTFSYQWTRDGADIMDATGKDYTVVSDDIGKRINVTVTSGNCLGSISSANTSPAVKAVPVFTVPTGLSAAYGGTLTDVPLPAGFSWEDATSTSVGNVGSNSFTVTYTPADTGNYNVVTGIPVTILVTEKPVTVTSVTVKTAPAKTAYTEGETLNLAGLVIILHKSNNTTEEVAYDDFGTRGITAAPADKTKLSASDTSVTVTYTADSKSVSLPITVGDALCLATYQGAQKRYNAESNTYDIRFIATINTVNADAVGFVFSKSQSMPTLENAAVRSTATVYTSITAMGTTVTATSLGGTYIIACTVTGIPASDANVPLYVRAFSTAGTETTYTSVAAVTLNNLP